ncbi:plasmid mobilization relaxosome protein MobC [Mesorhizobium sp. B2-4-19]|uniref:plasmid mobilization protein n=1 Tax=Mesorhizobium sp. B2-4-19 TaxID=2589930 RepID=UPI0015E44F70|nr:plasmid mobilization relaxosome protein MobC [Mesorhizobium sp. B2-4-19]
MSGTTTTTLRLSTDERAALDAAADAAGLGPSSYARQAVMRAVGRAASVRRRPDGLAQAIGRALGDLGRIGNLLNQMARHAHVGGYVPAQALEGCRRELSCLTATILALRQERSG